mmetsp:Transcript_35708/g.81455  ORF Transcript_35708/g.81455 Transcript_35708/m.81455 type:complete len:229 (+) Transcript_35708:1818-2504(+)
MCSLRLSTSTISSASSSTPSISTTCLCARPAASNLEIWGSAARTFLMPRSSGVGCASCLLSDCFVSAVCRHRTFGVSGAWLMSSRLGCQLLILRRFRHFWVSRLEWRSVSFLNLQLLHLPCRQIFWISVKRVCKSRQCRGLLPESSSTSRRSSHMPLYRRRPLFNGCMGNRIMRRQLVLLPQRPWWKLKAPLWNRNNSPVCQDSSSMLDGHSLCFRHLIVPVIPCIML